MISDAIWSDFDGDNDKDLILVGEWTDIMFFENQNGVFKKNTKLISRSNVGWWNCIKEFDIDKDGDLDYIVGNLGENYKYKASNEEPFEIFANDLDQNGSSDIVLGCYIDKKLYPIRGFQCSSEQMPSLSNKISSYEEFGLSDVYKIYGDAIKDAVNMKANIFSSVILRNNGGGFSIEKLPWQAQLAPIKDVILKDLNADGYLDVIGAGNWFVAEVETPRADSGTGIVLINNDGKGFSCMSATESGFFANRDVRRLLHLNAPSDKQEKIIVANNNSALQIFELN